MLQKKLKSYHSGEAPRACFHIVKSILETQAHLTPIFLRKLTGKLRRITSKSWV